MRSFSSRFVSPIVILALLAGSFVGPAMARTAGAPGGGAGSGGASSSAGTSGGSGAQIFTAAIVRLPPRGHKPQAPDPQQTDNAGCRGQMDAFDGQYCPIVQ
jgi:hypothetical protein